MTRRIGSFLVEVAPLIAIGCLIVRHPVDAARAWLRL